MFAVFSIFEFFPMIALTGATGFIGSYIADRLSFPQKRLTRNASLCLPSTMSCQGIHGDLHDIHTIKRLIQEAPTLIHLACTTNPRSSNQNIVEDIKQNLISTLQLFETFALTHPGGHIIFASSGGNMYNASVKDVMLTENDIPFPRSSYAIHKLSLEHYLRQFCERHKICATILRISNAYGSLLANKRDQGLIELAFAKLFAEEELQIIDSLDSVRDYIHLDDIAHAFQLVCQHPPSSGECRLFNISSGHGFTNDFVLNLIQKITKRTIKKHYPIKDLPSPSWSVLDSTKIQQKLGWQPTINLPEGIQKMWEQILK